MENRDMGEVYMEMDGKMEIIGSVETVVIMEIVEAMEIMATMGIMITTDTITITGIEIAWDTKQTTTMMFQRILNLRKKCSTLMV